MADTNTPNILLLLPDLGDVFNFSTHVENNLSVIDGLMGAVQCTSITRPSNTYAGQIVYETDSKRYVQNTGTKASPIWTYMSHSALSCTSSAHPTVGLTAGMQIYETDTARFRGYDGSAWNFVAGKNPSVKVHNSAAVNNNIPNITITALTWNTEDWRTDAGLHSVGTNPDRITPTELGLWRFEYAIAWATNSSGERETFIDINNAGSKFGWQSIVTVGGAFAMSGSYTARMNGTTDYAQCKAFQSSGVSLTCGGDTNTYFGATYLGRY